ncbi:CDF family Co(II)/Ni(II) efflux transporter DmeF [Burkholderia cenocepacia]|uniref:Cation transporter n=1 Tax=Burkholderia cenocepacia TaxID=95486 RepID=A0A1V2VS80_9BURK|nr:CDF family Co(II)/Ni(II) efflux transporter DmeF [Burkholderia cenocepacia]MBR8285412.1 CDF family Co(II)/Ni(II) efflux transporter DmeF [Burkholderia cenocepacia]MBR8497037.1 CDF family Co(II)/Ni(II) efflux transporter DmeF [Burkholderia cenocepacia]NDV73414.1 CDF family Co(II)/Ni(II) efflux transporter DmeF [Burkholderia cenocepacia]ONI98659.1 cation transporter [Burkholderia cenocepacia]ONJ21240.1 cation transporter [Burkholderia cenocepacia]
MTTFEDSAFGAGHDHIFLGAAHEDNERRTWMVIALCSAMMVAEIVGGSLFGSLALVADGLHMSTHAGAMLIAALAYTYARKHATDNRFAFGTGKLGDLAGFTSAIVLAMIALLIAYEAIFRFLSPIPIHFNQAIPIAVLGLLVNLASVWLLSGNHHGHSHGHSHGHGHGDEHGHESEVHRISGSSGEFALSVFEDGVPPVFRITPESASSKLNAGAVSITTIRPDGTRQTFAFADRGGYLESKDDIPEPHAFKAVVRLPDGEHQLEFEEHEHDHDDAQASVHRDHNIRSAYIHVIADAAISVLAIIGLLLARAFGWVWMDPLAGVIGALVIANWSWGLMRDTGGILLDMNPDKRMADNVRHLIEENGDTVLDLHVWRVGPGHMSAIVSVATGDVQRNPGFYRAALKRYKGLSHVTVEVNQTRVVA